MKTGDFYYEIVASVLSKVFNAGGLYRCDITSVWTH